MPLNSVQTYLKGVLNGLALPFGSPNLTAMITPPDPGDGMLPAVYIWGSTGEEARQTMPRAKPGLPSTGGFKVILYRVDCWLIWFGDAENANADSAFPAVIDVVTNQLRTTLMPVLNLVDPVTSGTSNLLAVGENIDVDYAPVHATEDQRYLCYTARVICEIKEQIQA